jgi:hypothetical protein
VSTRANAGFRTSYFHPFSPSTPNDYTFTFLLAAAMG